MSVARNCMIVNLSLGVWAGYRLDKTASREVTERAGAETDAARVNKHLIDKAVLKPIVASSGAIRQHFYTKTLPWKDNGDRILTRQLYAPFIEEHQRLVGEFNAAVSDFVDRTYVAAKAQAEFRMGALFKADDYPSPRELRHKFYAHLDIDAVSEAHDFRVALDKSDVAEIRTGMEQAMKERLGRAMQDVWDRLSQTVAHFQAKMADGDAIFRDTTVSNLRELVDLLPGLNILDDANLTKIHRDLAANLTGYDPADLRRDPDLREEAADEAARIMQEMSGFMKAFGKAA